MIMYIRYTADKVHGTVMEVTYEGEAHHPDLVFPTTVFPATPPRLARSNTTPRPPSPRQRRRKKNYSSYISDKIMPFLHDALTSYPTPAPRELTRRARNLQTRKVVRRRRKKKIPSPKQLKRKARYLPTRKLIRRRRKKMKKKVL